MNCLKDCYWDCHEGASRLLGDKKPVSPLRKAVQQQLLHGGSESLVDVRSLLLRGGNSARNYQRYYKKTRALGQGAFGAVFEVKHLATGQMRALKEVPMRSEDDRKYSVIELEAMVKLDHPNVLKLFEFYEDAQCMYLVTELCSGGDFSVLGRGDVSQRDFKLLFGDVFAALAYCHDQGVAHRDMKFENCLIDDNNPARKTGKLIDFGLAGLQKGDGKEFNQQLGTKYWVAPEVVNKKVKYGVKCDNWAVGVMLFILFTDEHPCAADAHSLSQKELLRKIQAGEVRVDILRKARVPKGLEELIRGLLQKDQDKRTTAKDALKNAWVASVEDDEERANIEFVQSHSLSMMMGRARAFQGYSQFEKAVLALVAHQKREQKVAELRQVFLTLDKEGNGTLSEAEITQGVKDAGIHMGAQEMHDIFAGIDTSADGKVHISEWLAATMEPSHLASEQAIKQVFDFFDMDRTGSISKEELSAVLGSADEAAQVMKDGDSSGDGTLSRTEFAALMEKVALRLSTRSSGKLPSI